ncbi:hypothetical protein BDN70DRAFT_901765 [Pholiota conissans]|uniref:Uncharacterized protein n=1 Tax=Pholiota conissans TaxID=109636 RepID=A0A9P5YNM2_9AGAR|nr:hypothetical protein BDN70DRAFT_901765 [Pholiota conissans]
MHVALCNADFYPLIQIRTKGMSYEDKVAYRVKSGVPRTIDEWIADAKMRVNAPTANPHIRGPYLDYPLWQDDVECILNVVHEEVSVELSAVQNTKEFTLTLRVRIPPTTNYLMHYWQSPTVIIDKYTWNSHGSHSPDWLQTVQTERWFWQSRILMLEMMLYFARNIHHNSRVARRVSSWCSAMSTPVSGLLPRVRPRSYFDPVSPCKKRNHKPRASDLSARESKKLRKTLNEGSPSRRQKWK